MTTPEIFIVDDDKAMRQSTRQWLELSGYRVKVFDRAGKVLDIIDRDMNGIIISDVKMPGMNGIVAASEIYATSRKTRVLALSRHNEKQYVSEMFATGALGYILKDSAVEELIKAIHTVVSGQLYCSPSLMDVVISDYSERLTHSETSELTKLTPREMEVLKLIADGKTLKEVANDLYISYQTVATHRSQIMKKLDIHTDVELAKLAIREGLARL